MGVEQFAIIPIILFIGNITGAINNMCTFGQNTMSVSKYIFEKFLKTKSEPDLITLTPYVALIKKKISIRIIIISFIIILLIVLSVYFIGEDDLGNSNAFDQLIDGAIIIISFVIAVFLLFPDLINKLLITSTEFEILRKYNLTYALYLVDAEKKLEIQSSIEKVILEELQDSSRKNKISYDELFSNLESKTDIKYKEELIQRLKNIRKVKCKKDSCYLKE